MWVDTAYRSATDERFLTKKGFVANVNQRADYELFEILPRQTGQEIII